MGRSKSLFALLLALSLATTAQVAHARGHEASDATVENPNDGTRIAITVFRPANASEETRVPVILHSHGWGGTRTTEIGGDVERFLDAGIGVVSIDQRGHGESEGQAHVQDPTKETEDIQAVIDHVAKLGWVALDGPGDPVLGAIGGSYGGGYQTMTALDESHESGRTRFDALAPQITWYDLPESLAPNKVVRSSWTALLYAAGASMVPDHIHEGFVWGSATNQWPDGTLYGERVPGAPNLDRIFHRHSPAWFVERGITIDIPVLIRQGITDNLFNLNEGMKLFEKALSPAARRQSYLIGYNGGHALPSVMPPGTPMTAQLGGGVDTCSPNGDFTKLTIEFFERVFAGRSTDGLLPARYNFTAADEESCLRTNRPVAGRPIKVDATGIGTTITTAGLGAPLHIPVAVGPAAVRGIPRLSGKVTSVGLDARAFFALSVGTTPADARVVQNNLLPLRRVMPVQDQRFEMALPGVAVDVPQGQTLFLTITPFSDLSFGHGSRTPGTFLLSNLKVALPATAGPGH